MEEVHALGGLPHHLDPQLVRDVGQKLIVQHV
jgi:hypothetical protein